MNDMPATKKKKHPFVAKVQCEADIRGISEQVLAVTMRMSASTYGRRKKYPNKLSAGELTKLAKKLNMEIVITSNGLDCKKIV